MIYKLHMQRSLTVLEVESEISSGVHIHVRKGDFEGQDEMTFDKSFNIEMTDEQARELIQALQYSLKEIELK